MPYRATLVSNDPLGYFMQHDENGPRLYISDIVLRNNHHLTEVFAHLIRFATDSKWSHSALVYLTNEPEKGLENTFLIEARTSGVNMTSWRNEVLPSDEFTVGIKRPKLDWYQENEDERARRNRQDPADIHGIEYLRHVRGVAIDQVHGLYDQKIVWELASLYVERVARRHLHTVPQVADAADKLADFFKKWDQKSKPAAHVARFICSGLVQYSFFAALRYRLLQDFQHPERQESARHNLRHMGRILYREDPDGLMENYIQRILAGEQKLADPVPDDLQDLLKTALPADFNNSPNLEWHYIVLNGNVWQIDEAPANYVARNTDEAAILDMIRPEHNPLDDAKKHENSPAETQTSSVLPLEARERK